MITIRDKKVKIVRNTDKEELEKEINNKIKQMKEKGYDPVDMNPTSMKVGSGLGYKINTTVLIVFAEAT